MPEVSEEVPSLRTPSGGSSHAHVVAFHHTQTPISGVVTPAIGVTTNGMGVMALDTWNQSVGDVTQTLRDPNGTFGDAVPATFVNNGMESWHERETAITLCARDAKGANNAVVVTLDFGGHGGSYNGQDAYQGRIRPDAGRPRRLTPKECERLMSWPDDHTRYGVKEDGTAYELSDTARYRLCGNGVGSVQVQWIAERLAAALVAANYGHSARSAAA